LNQMERGHKTCRSPEHSLGAASGPRLPAKPEDQNILCGGVGGKTIKGWDERFRPNIGVRCNLPVKIWRKFWGLMAKTREHWVWGGRGKKFTGESQARNQDRGYKMEWGYKRHKQEGGQAVGTFSLTSWEKYSPTRTLPRILTIQLPCTVGPQHILSGSTLESQMKKHMPFTAPLVTNLCRTGEECHEGDKFGLSHGT